jgi:anhydro-N-acetylmuramic acid kinase
MNQYISRLANIAAKPTRTIIGLMSGTSLDGLDIALCEMEGNGIHTKVKVPHFTTIPFDQQFKDFIKAVFAKKTVDLELLCVLNPWIAEQHAKMILAALKEWGINTADIDLLASHGQTIYHAPKILHQKQGFGNATLQIGDGDHLAVNTGIITISDFRQKHIAAGGEGAPLAVYGDYLIFSKLGEERIMLNIGGIANFTYLAGDLDVAKVFSTDTGPGNTLMDAYAQLYFDLPYDKDAAIAKKGVCNELLLTALMQNDFFNQQFPKTTGPELFNLHYLNNAITKVELNDISHYDVMATLNSFTANTIVAALKQTTTNENELVIYSSGGGMHNPLLMEQLQTQLPNCKFLTTDALNVHPDAKEAVLFALLANECVAGGNIPIGGGSADIPAVVMGKISLPG